MTDDPHSKTPGQRTTIVVTQRERFGMTAESLEDLIAKTPGAKILYIDGNSPARWRDYLAEQQEAGRISLIRTDYYLTPNQARNLALDHVDTEYLVFCDNDVLFTPGWLDALVRRADATGADVVAPLTCQGLPAHTQVHHAGGDYAAGGARDQFFASEKHGSRVFKETMHGHAEDIGGWQNARAGETGMCEFHCVLVRTAVFERIGRLDEAMLSSKEHIDFSMTVKQSGGEVWFEPASVVTYVFPCRARPMSPEDWPYFALRWSDSYGRRSLDHFFRKWRIASDPGYVKAKTNIYVTRRWQGMLIPMFRRLPGIGRHDRLARGIARAMMFPERIANRLYVARHDRRVARLRRADSVAPSQTTKR